MVRIVFVMIVMMTSLMVSMVMIVLRSLGLKMVRVVLVNYDDDSDSMVMIDSHLMKSGVSGSSERRRGRASLLRKK